MQEVGGDPILIWNCVIEPDFGQERFLTEHPITAMINGRFAKIPVMLGVTEIEFGMVSYSKHPIIVHNFLRKALIKLIFSCHKR